MKAKETLGIGASAEQSERIQEILGRFRLPAYTEIPDVGLYLEQVTRFINQSLVDFPDMQATSSMISNYVKLKMVSRPVKKMYSREQIASLLFIVLAKTVLSMDNIRKLFAMITETAGMEEGYEYFRKCMEAALVSFGEEKGTAGGRNMLDYTAAAIAYKMYLNLYFEGLTDSAQEGEEE